MTIPAYFGISMQRFTTLLSAFFRKWPWQFGVYAVVAWFAFQTGESKKAGARHHDFHSNIFADKAGYYIYLPAFFIHDFDASHIPIENEKNFGYGFELSRDKVIRTKYTYGVALLQAPFFLAVHSAQQKAGQPATGFEEAYERVPAWAGAFYLFAGLCLLSATLGVYFSKGVSILSVLLVGLSTNLFYYASAEPGMAHVYSFFLFAACLRVFVMLLRKPESMWIALLVMFLFSFSILIRPTNVLFLCVLIFWEADGQWKQRVRWLFQPRKIAAMAAMLLLVFLPQLFYWHYATGSWLTYSYTKEGFTNAFLPPLHWVWFSFQNGLFPNTPIWVVILGSSVWMGIRQMKHGLGLILLFLLCSYVFASWHDPLFGCAFGHRCFIEWLVPFSFALAWLVSRIAKQRIWIWMPALLVAAGFIHLNLKMTWTFDACWNGMDKWDWPQYKWLVTSPSVMGQSSFETNDPQYPRSKVHVKHREWSMPLHGTQVFSPSIRFTPDSIGVVNPRRMVVQFDAWFTRANSKLTLVIENEVDQADRYWSGNDFMATPPQCGHWERMEKICYLPANFNASLPMRLYFHHPGADTVYVDRLRYWIH